MIENTNIMDIEFQTFLLIPKVPKQRIFYQMKKKLFIIVLQTLHLLLFNWQAVKGGLFLACISLGIGTTVQFLTVTIR